MRRCGQSWSQAQKLRGAPTSLALQSVARHCLTMPKLLRHVEALLRSHTVPWTETQLNVGLPARALCGRRLAGLLDITEVCQSSEHSQRDAFDRLCAPNRFPCPEQPPPQRQPQRVAGEQRRGRRRPEILAALRGDEPVDHPDCKLRLLVGIRVLPAQPVTDRLGEVAHGLPRVLRGLLLDPIRQRQGSGVEAPALVGRQSVEVPRRRHQDVGLRIRRLLRLLHEQRLKRSPPLLPTGRLRGRCKRLPAVPILHVSRRPAFREHAVAGHAVEAVAHSDVAPADVLQHALRPVRQRAPPELLARRGHVGEVHEGRPVDAAGADRPVGVAVREVLQQLLRHRRDEDPVAERVYAQAVPQGLERGAVVDA
mmetsp:Transcript_78080/g.196225  ORF Transcript_78080/g.196225 Transcript_78080/m.196225 type:complete len:367 (-) Transcript_78080:282-1382(-)